MRTAHIIITCLLLCSLNSCAQPPVQNPLISGPWLITLITNDVGRLQAVMNFEADEQRSADTVLFHAYTEKDMDRKILGGMKATLGRIAGSNFKDGSLIRISKGQLIHQDTLHGILVTPFGNYFLNASLDHNRISGTLSNGNHLVVGTVAGLKGQPKMPLHDYRMIVDSALKTAESKLYDPALLKGDAWLDVRKEIRRISTLTGDDAALVMAFFYYARKLPFSHFALYVPASADTSSSVIADADLLLSSKSPNTAYLKINSFGGRAIEMEKVFNEIVDKEYSNLIVDLRGNPGGSIEAGMAFAQHLLKDTLYAGILLTQQYFRTHASPPMPKDYPEFLSFSESNYHLLLKGIAEYPGICLKGIPKAPSFKGRVYILTDKRTASTCEPIVYALKQHQLATVVGQKTAGAMLNGESFPAGDGYMITVPTATYYTSDGFKIDRQGVAPDIILKDEDALDYVLKQINGVESHD